MRKLAVGLVLILVVAYPASAWEFAVVADFLNQDSLTTKQKRHTARILDSIASEDPEFVLVPGDLAMAHWYWSGEEVHEKGNRYYGKWKERFDKRGLKYYTAVGDHELGDIPAIHFQLQGYLVPDFKETYRENFDNPENGPRGLEELAYYFTYKNTLFVTVQTFHCGRFLIHNRLSEAQLEWLRTILESRGKSAEHIIVQGHLPVLPVNGGYRSSQLTVEENSQSEFWEVMAKYDVDLYLAGEFHTFSIRVKDGITQIVTGGIVGKTPVHYAVISLSNEISYQIKTVH